MHSKKNEVKIVTARWKENPGDISRKIQHEGFTDVWEIILYLQCVDTYD